MKIKLISVFVLVLVLIPLALAQEDGNYLLGGFELEKVVALVNALICTILFVLALVAYKRDGRKRLLYVSIAFLLFAIKSFLISSELFFSEVEFFDPLSTFLELFAILSFFFGVLKNEK